MDYKDLLVVLDAAPTARERIDLAAALADRRGAHLVGFTRCRPLGRHGISATTIRR